MGRAWGNALGGYKRQKRDSKGRFGTGSGRGAKLKERYNKFRKKQRLSGAAKRQYRKGQIKDLGKAAAAGYGAARATNAIGRAFLGDASTAPSILTGVKVGAATYTSARLRRNGKGSTRKRIRG